jgi:poly(3-hydroxybutyrate) depolymerase
MTAPREIVSVRPDRAPAHPMLGSSLAIIALCAVACGDSRGDENDSLHPVEASGAGGVGGSVPTGMASGGLGGTSVVASGGSGGAGTPDTGGGAASGGASATGAGSGGTSQGADSGTGGPTSGGSQSDAGPADAGADAAIEPTCDKIPPSSKDCAQPLAPGDDRKCSMTVALEQRSYYLYAPPTYDPCKPTALVIDCHGALETAEAQAGIDKLHIAVTSNGDLEYPGIGSGWRLEADTPEGGFIVVTPQGIDNVWTTQNSDPQFFLSIVAETKKIANIDPAKVYMTGISNGSIISFETACQNPTVFSGIAAFSAGRNCSGLSKPIPVISFDAEPDFAYQSTVDASATMVRLNQCKSAVDPNWLTIDSMTTDDVCRNDPFDTDPTLVPCNTITKTSITTAGIEPTVCKRWSDCNGGVAVVFCDVAPSTLHGAANAAVDAHILYGNASSLNMPSVAWRFFKSFWK